MGRGSVVVGVLHISWERKEEKVCGEGECSRGSTVHQLGEEGREGMWGGECSRGSTVHQLGEEGREGVWGGGV